MPQPFHIGGAAAVPLFGSSRPGIHLVRDLFENAFRAIDASRASHALTVWNLGMSVIPNVLDFLYSLRHYIRTFFTSSVTIKASDELYLQVFNWLATRESQRRFVKEYTAQTLSDGRTKPKNPGRHMRASRGVVTRESTRIKYVPAFKTTWFFFQRNLFGILRNDKYSPTMNAPTSAIPVYDYFGPVAIMESKESVTITCLGWSTIPIQNLLETCRDMAEDQRRSSVTIRSCRSHHWEVSAVKPIRSLDTIHLDQDVKESLINDLEKYLDPQRRNFYSEQGIPYRRGYLLHGPPGCGKSSLSLALAGKFGLDLYMANLSNLQDGDLESLFAVLPARCLVLLEDIDAVGLKRQEEDPESWRGPHAYKCSLSSLLNVLDGVASQEGRVVIMTSNLPDQLDDALVRPGRIDIKIHMGYITQRGAQQIFLRMMKTARFDKIADEVPDGVKSSELEAFGGDSQTDGNQTDEDLQALAQKFCEQVPEGMFTPAQLQGYLLQRLHSALAAVDEIADWVAAEKQKVKEEAENKEKARKEAEKRQAEAEAKYAAEQAKHKFSKPRPVIPAVALHLADIKALLSATSKLGDEGIDEGLEDGTDIVHEVA
ncbi:P-loop containing nucleoside triphosphate hydrolase protein [Xylariaceae sp. FL1651]|nr:P-loop containing nucleoside triphosphate hydrolase protein [Xylariaceae sp. FL1651]